MNYLQRATRIVEAYCSRYGLTPDDLKKRTGNRYPMKKIRDVSTANMRLALALDLKKRFPAIPQVKIAELVGYKTHCSVCRCNRGHIDKYLELNDPVFMPYWKELQEVAEV